MYTNKEFGIEVGGFKHLVKLGLCTTQCKTMLFCVKTAMRESNNFEIAYLREEECETYSGRLVTFGFGTFVMFSCTNRSLFGIHT